jgi:glucose/arabinose dehydrogenase
VNVPLHQRPEEQAKSTHLQKTTPKSSGVNRGIQSQQLLQWPYLGYVILTALLILGVGYRWFGQWQSEQGEPLYKRPDQNLTSYALPDKLPLDEEALSHLKTEPGFQVSLAAQNLENSGWMAWGPGAKTLYVSQPKLGSVIALQDHDGDGIFETHLGKVVTLPGVSGMTIHGNQIYLATTKTIYRALLYTSGKVSHPSPLINGLPDGGQHPYRSVTYGPDGFLYVSLGSYYNAAKEPTDETAAILKISPDAKHREVFASGIRHTVGLDWHPDTGKLWGMEMGSDWDMSDIPPEELNLIEPHKHYGYPWCYGMKQADPFIESMPEGESQTDFCNRTESSAQIYQAHANPTGFLFYRNKPEFQQAFPKSYHHQAFVTMYGSTHRKEPVGYSIVRIEFDEKGNPIRFVNFVEGFLSLDKKTHSGRPYGIIQAPDGSLLVSDEASGAILRIRYTG